MDGYYGLMASLGAVDPPLFFFGGIAEDILFNGTLTRPHGDLDVLVYRHELPMRLRQFDALGFSAFEVYHQPRPDAPLVTHAVRDDLHLEPSIFELEDERSFFIIDDPRGRLYRVYLPEDSFAYPPVTTERGPVRIVSPRCLYQIRAALQELGIFGDLRPTDQVAQTTLRTRFLADLPAADLTPEIVPLENAGVAPGA